MPGSGMSIEIHLKSGGKVRVCELACSNATNIVHTTQLVVCNERQNSSGEVQKVRRLIQ